LWSFYHRLYTYGHNLDPTASIKVEPFTPPLFGTKQIANFSVTSFPDFGSFALAAFSILLLAAIIWSRNEVDSASTVVSSSNIASARQAQGA